MTNASGRQAQLPTQIRVPTGERVLPTPSLNSSQPQEEWREAKRDSVPPARLSSLPRPEIEAHTPASPPHTLVS